MLASPLNTAIVRYLAQGPKSQTDLRGQTGLPAQTTLRAQLNRLVRVGAIEKRRRNRFPGTLEYELTGAGRDLLPPVEILERWLEYSPDGPIPLGSRSAKAVIGVLAEGWSSTMLHALATGPLSLTDLDRVIASLSYPSLERRLGAMRLTGLVRACSSGIHGTPYSATDWLRHGVAPLVATARWERRHLPGTAPRMSGLDLEAVFLLSMPFLQLPREVAGICRLAVEASDGEPQGPSGVIAEVRESQIVSCTTQLNATPDAWATGFVSAWLDALSDGDAGRLELGGDCALVEAVLDSMHGEASRTRSKTHP